MSRKKPRELPEAWFTPGALAKAKARAGVREVPMAGTLDQAVLDDARAALARHDALDLAQMLGLEVAA